MDQKREDKIYTIDDIARELGVSKTTVSRAISGKGRISAATRQRVFSFIEQHDYRPNVLARGLAQSKTYNLGLILPGDYTAMDFPFFKECMDGICEAASQHGYDIVIAIDDSGKKTTGYRMVTGRKVDGIILSRSTVSAASVQNYLKEKRMPFVLVGPSDDKTVMSVDNQNAEGSRELTEVLLMKGGHRLALLGGSRAHRVTESRLEGFLEAHRAHGIRPEQTLIFLDVENYAQTARALEQLLEKKADGLVCMDDFITGMALGYLLEKHIRIPEDIRLASLYDSRQLELYRPTVTSLHFDTKGLGKKACLTLLRHLGEEIKEEEAALNYQVILRESTK